MQHAPGTAAAGFRPIVPTARPQMAAQPGVRPLASAAAGVPPALQGVQGVAAGPRGQLPGEWRLSATALGL